jgi:protein-L-isoaspartate(D-aspartate) O-methyltransferase
MRFRDRGLPTMAILGLSIGLWLDPALAADPADQREQMVRVVQQEVLLLSGETGVNELDPRVVAALRQVPREAFVPEALRPYAYEPHPLPLGYDQNLAAPFLVAFMTHLVAPKPGDVVFETGTDVGYQAAVLSLLAAKVYSVEVIEPLADQAARVLKERGYDNVSVQASDGYYGWPEKAPFDAIVIKEAIDHVPPPLLQQLKRGGRMVMPLGPEEGVQTLTLLTKDQDGKIHQKGIMPVRFSPLQGGERL